MSVKTDLPYKITPYPYFRDDPVCLGTAEGAVWYLKPHWVNKKLPILEIQRNSNCGKFKIDITLKFSSSRYAQSSDVINYIKYIEDGQKTTVFETFLPASFERPQDEVRGSVIISNYMTEVNPRSLGQLSNDILRLLNNQDSFSDVTLICGDTKFFVHKCILSARSSVFADMFKNKMQKGISSIYTIEDVEASVLQIMLKYIYSGKIDDLNVVLAGGLLFAADKYQLKELSLICVDKLKSSLRETNVFSILLLGDLHDPGLKDEAMQFVCKFNKFSDLENTEEWNSLRRNHPDLAIDLLIFVVKYLERN